MGLQKLIDNHFNPSAGIEKQVPDNSFQSNALAVGGLALIGTASIGYLFFGAKAKTAAMLAGAGISFFASYLTERDGYAWLVAIVAAAGMTYATVDAINAGRLWVTVHFDIADIIRAVQREHIRAR